MRLFFNQMFCSENWMAVSCWKENGPDLGTKKGTKAFMKKKGHESINLSKMLARQTRNFARPTSSPFLSSCLLKRLFSLTSSPPSPTRLVPGAAVDVADVTGADDLAYIDPPVSSIVKPLMTPTLLQPRVVVYDGVCHLCHGGVKWIIGVDKYRKIKFCCLQSKAAEPYLKLCGLDREDVLRRFLFVEGPGLYHQASTAALKVLSYMPLPYSALSSLLIVPAPLRDAVYDHVAKRRYDWFGKSEDCLVLREKELLERFIDRHEMMH